MQGDFELNKAGWYELVAVEENTYLNDKLENTNYGIWYTAGFQDNAETVLWQTKTPPEVGKKYWGWVENTKSGKALKFKWDKQNTPSSSEPSAVHPASSAYESPERQNSINRGVEIEE